MAEIVVIGAGLSGLACARRLHGSGFDVLVTESGDGPGGVVQSHRVDGYLLESGPNTILPTDGAIEQIREAGIEDELVAARPRSARFVYVGGRLRRVPWVLGPAGILRAAAEPFVRARTRAPDGSFEDESIRSFFTRRFGRQVHDRLAAPFVGGIYAGDTGQLSLESTFPRLIELERRHGSVVRGMFSERKTRPRRHGLASFRAGMATLPEALARGLDVRYRTPATGIRSGWEVDAGGRTVNCRAVVIAAPSHAGADLIRTCNPGLGKALDEVWYAPMVVAAVSADATSFPKPLEGFGFLVPPDEGLRILGVLFSSSLFPGRVPSGRVLLTAFVGGARFVEIVDWSDSRIWETVCGEVAGALSLPPGSVSPVRLFRYQRAIPQYRIGHTEWRRAVDEQLGRTPGLFLTGNYLDGVSVPMTMEHGASTADAVIKFIRREE